MYVYQSYQLYVYNAKNVTTSITKVESDEEKDRKVPYKFIDKEKLSLLS